MLLLWSPVAKYSGRDVSVICPNGCRCRFWTCGRTLNLLQSLSVGRRGFLRCHSGNVVRLVLAETFSAFWRLSGGGSFMFVQTRTEFLPVLVLNRGWFKMYSFQYFACRRLKLNEAGASFPLCLVWLPTVRECGQSWHFNDMSEFCHQLRQEVLLEVQ